MPQVTLGRTGLTVCKDGFGALPVQRAKMEDAVAILQAALDGGINFFDTARAYTDSEEKIGRALSARRSEFVLASKTMAGSPEAFWQDLKTSLDKLRCDTIDIYQFHNQPFCPKPGDGTGMYEAMKEAQSKGLVRFIGITNHRLAVARQAAESGLYDTVQYPFSYLSGKEEEDLVALCRQNNVGFIAMKALSGGLITDVETARNWMLEFENVVPIWGIQRMEELEKLFCAQKAGQSPTAAQRDKIERDKTELAGEFCRGCGYCMPCPVGIEINNCARMSLFLRRAPEATYLTDEWKQKMAKIEECTHCNQCAQKCPYGLQTPELLAKNLEDYKTFM